MSEKMASTDDDSPDVEEQAPAAPTPPKRGPGHRGQDVRDTMAEMAAKAHEISLEAGSRMTSTMREVVGAAAGLTVFAVESARDLVQYMVRRGQMSQDEADKLMREVESAHATSPRPLLKVEAPKESTKKAASSTPSSPVAPPPLTTLEVEPPVVARVAGAVAPAPLTEEEIASLPDSDGESKLTETAKSTAKAGSAKDSAPAKGSAAKSSAKGASSKAEPAPKAASPKAAPPKSAPPKAGATTSSASKGAAKAPAKSSAKSPAKATTTKAPAKAAAKPATKKAVPKKK